MVGRMRREVIVAAVGTVGDEKDKAISQPSPEQAGPPHQDVELGFHSKHMRKPLKDLLTFKKQLIFCLVEAEAEA